MNWIFIVDNVLYSTHTRISFCRAVEPAFRKIPSTSMLSMMRAQASDTNSGIRHSEPFDNFTSVNSKLFKGTPNILWWTDCCVKFETKYYWMCSSGQSPLKTTLYEFWHFVYYVACVVFFFFWFLFLFYFSIFKFGFNLWPTCELFNFFSFLNFIPYKSRSSFTMIADSSALFGTSFINMLEKIPWKQFAL